MKGQLIEVVLYLVIFGIIGIASIAKAVRRAKQQARDQQGRPEEPKGRAPADEVRDFLEEVARRASREMGYPGSPPKPAPPPQAEMPRPTAPPPARERVRVPARPARAARPARKPTPKKPVAAPPKRKLSLREEMLIADREAAAKSKAAAVQPTGTRRRASWLERLPEKPLARGIVLREILGLPRSLDPRGDVF